MEQRMADLRLSDLEFFKILLPGMSKKNLLRLPAKFAGELGARRAVKLRLDGGGGRPVWDVQVVSNGAERYLGRGWKQFARAHDLRDGYLLVFRYHGAGVLAVTVFDGSTCSRDYPSAAGGGGSSARSATGSVRRVFKDEETPAGGSAGGDARATADADESQFAVTLRPCNLGAKQYQYLNVPVYFQDAHGYARRRRVALRMGRRSWTVNLKHAKRSNGGDRTAFKYGWNQFCVDNGLDVGDVCFFRALGEDEEDDEDVHVLKVEVRKTDGTLLA
ncbi:hypothetical protein ACP70R_016703 [Stipagrostis hirtigluma subsp. patula]